MLPCLKRKIEAPMRVAKETPNRLGYHYSQGPPLSPHQATRC